MGSPARLWVQVSEAHAGVGRDAWGAAAGQRRRT